MTLFVIRNVWCLFSMDINNVCSMYPIYTSLSGLTTIFHIIYIAYLGAFLFCLFFFLLASLLLLLPEYLYFIKWKRIRILRAIIQGRVTWVPQIRKSHWIFKMFIIPCAILLFCNKVSNKQNTCTSVYQTKCTFASTNKYSSQMPVLLIYL